MKEQDYINARDLQIVESVQNIMSTITPEISIIDSEEILDVKSKLNKWLTRLYESIKISQEI